MKVKYTRSNLMFLIAYAVWITVTLLKYTYIKNLLSSKFSMNDILMYAKWLTYIFLILKFWEDGVYRFRNFVGLAIVFYIGCIEYYVRDNTVLLFMLCIFVYGASNVDFDDILKVSLFVEVLVLVITVGLSLEGIIPNNIWDEGIRHRYDLGFIYCTFGSHLMLFITMVYSCIRKRITLIEAAGLLAVSLWLYSYNNTRIDLCIVIPFLVFFYIWTHFSGRVRNNFINKIMFQYSGVLMAIVSIGVQAFYNPDILLYVRLNSLLSNRLDLGRRAIQEYGFTLFGQHIKWIGQGGIKKNPLLIYNYVDCSFLKYTLNYGIIFIVLLMIGLVYIGKKAIEREDMALCASLLFLYVFAMVDAELCVLAFHPFLLKIGELINPVPRMELDEAKRKIYIARQSNSWILKRN